MNRAFRTGSAVAFLMMAAPIFSSIYAAPPSPGLCSSIGLVYTPGPPPACISAPDNAPEISASEGVGGVALLFCGVMMLRGRKRNVATLAA